MNYTIRKAMVHDFDEVNAIMEQVQQLHVDWRPDIYKQYTPIFSFVEFHTFVLEDTFYVAESNDKVIGIMRIVIKYVESPTHVIRDIILVDTMAIDENFQGKGIGHMSFEKVKEIKNKWDSMELNSR